MRYLTSDEVAQINCEVLGNKKAAILNRNSFESAVFRPQQTVFGSEAYPCIYTKAAALLHSLAMNHSLADGNKRTAFLSMTLFIKLNGLRVNWTATQAENFVLAIVTQHWNIDEIANWIQEHTK